MIKSSLWEEETSISLIGFWSQSVPNTILTRAIMNCNDGSLNESLFYSDNLHQVTEGNDLFAKEIVVFYKYLKSYNYPTARSYNIIASFYLKNSDFPTLKTCYSNYASSKLKLNWNVSFQKSSSIAFVDNCKYVSTCKSYIHVTI